MSYKASRQTKPIIYGDGIVCGWVGIIPRPKAPLFDQAAATALDKGATWAIKFIDFSVLQVTNNGMVWSYVLRPMLVMSGQDIDVAGARHWDVKFPGSYVSRDAQNQYRAPAVSKLEARFRAPLEWAKRDIAKRSKLAASDPGALMYDCAYNVEAPKDLGNKLPGPCGPITYTGIANKVGAYTLAQLHEITAKAVSDCIAVWKWRSAESPVWKPSNLEVMLHSGKVALGLAFAPGTGAKLNKRTISLNKILLAQYDAHSIWRVIVHELCHHYRDEVFAGHEVDPVEREVLLQAVKAYLVNKGSRAAVLMQKTLGTHDATFVRELGKVDPKIKENAVSGMIFTEYADQSLVAEGQAKRVALKQKLASKVSWDPTAGRVYLDYLKKGRFNVWWMPLAKGQWKPVRERLNGRTIMELMKQLGPNWGSAKVTYSPTWPSYWTQPDTLEKAVPYLEHNIGIFIVRYA
jgi:hypothetical protein